MKCAECGKDFRSEMALRGHRRVCPPRQLANDRQAPLPRAVRQPGSEHPGPSGQPAGEPAAQQAQPAVEPAHDARRLPQVYAAHEMLQELVAGAWDDAEELAPSQLKVWLPVLVRVTRCAEKVERMVVRGQVQPTGILDAYLDAVKLQATWRLTLRQADPELAKSNDDYYRGALDRLVGSLRALLPGPRWTDESGVDVLYRTG